MSETPPNVDQRLWFTLKSDPTTRHYLCYNPHTFPGRVGAWGMVCDGARINFCVSKYEMATCSPEAELWLAGYLIGNEPPPPVDSEGMPQHGSSEYASWEEATSRFHKTGAWSAHRRSCEICGKLLQPSDLPGLRCDDHSEKLKVGE